MTKTTKPTPAKKRRTYRSRPVKKNKNLTVCTIVSKNYLPYARVLAESFLEHNRGEVYVLLVDRVDGYFDPKKERFNLIEIEELRDMVPEFDKFCFKYTILELNTAIKPYLLEHLFTKKGVKKLIYFDPDILVTNSLNELSGMLDKFEVVLTPHLTAPIEDEYLPNEMTILQAGTYNLGFIALRRTANILEFVRWWQRRLHDRCIVDHANGIFVDQKWMDLVPGFLDKVFILREPGYNVAYWNYHCRDVRIEDGSISVNNKPAYFFHFSGFDPENLMPVSKHQNRYTLKQLSNMHPLFELYRDKVLAHGWEETKNWPYAWDKFDNGVKIPPAARRLYLELEDREIKSGNPFEAVGEKSFFPWLNKPERPDVPEISRFLFKMHQMQPDVKKAYPDILGQDKEPFLVWLVTYAKNIQNLDDKFLSHLSEKRKGLARLWFKIYLYRGIRYCASSLSKFHSLFGVKRK